MIVKQMIQELKKYNPNSRVRFNDSVKNQLHELVIMGYDQDELDYQNNKTENTIVEMTIEQIEESKEVNYEHRLNK